MPVQTFFWEGFGPPAVGQTAYIVDHGYCGPVPYPCLPLVSTGVVRSWVRRLPRSRTILVEVDLETLVDLSEEDMVVLDSSRPTSWEKILRPAL